MGIRALYTDGVDYGIFPAACVFWEKCGTNGGQDQTEALDGSIVRRGDALVRACFFPGQHVSVF